MKNKNDWTGGLSFWKWYFKKSQLAYKIIPIVIAFFYYKLYTNPFDRVEWVYGFMTFVVVIFWIKTWQHWNDLKHGRSR